MTSSTTAAAPPPVGRPLESLVDAYGETLVELGARDPSMVVLGAEGGETAATRRFRESHPSRYFSAPAVGPSTLGEVSGTAADRRMVFASDFSVFTTGFPYHTLRQSVCENRANVKIVTSRAGVFGTGSGEGAPMLEDIGLMRGLPGMSILVPADAPSARAAVRAVAEMDGPAYVRLASHDLPTVTEGQLALGRANELRAGSDLTIVAVGPLVSRALEVAEELHHVGVETRVIDLASVKPFDEKAVLRAARDTGAILTMEDHSVLTGVGNLVASATCENYPVPVRRLGVPDVFLENGDPWALLDRYGLSKERALEEAWELLGLRGKVT